jgi:hypothetical protein
MSSFVSNIYKRDVFGKNSIFVMNAKLVFHWEKAKLR